MNGSLKGLASLALRLSKSGLIAPCGIRACRRIHSWVRPTLLDINRRKQVELEKYPERAKPQPRSSFVDWNYQAEIYAFGKRLSEEFDEALLKQAFIDKSYVHKERVRREELGLEANDIDLKDNSELREIGRDRLTSTLIMFIKKEFPKLPAEGLESVVFKLTSPSVLAFVSSHIGTKELIQSDAYPPSDEILSRTFEAVVGALEQSSGRERAEKFVVDFVGSHLCGKDINDFWDIPKPWHMLLDMNNQTGGGPLEARLLREAGKNTLLSAFVVGIYDVNKKLVGTGLGETVDIAQEMAARDVLNGMFGTKGPSKPFEFQSANYPEKLIPHVRSP